MRILLIQLNLTIGDLSGNTQKILLGLKDARSRGADIALFPELAITGYPPEDFLLQETFIDEVELCLNKIVDASAGIITIVGLPRRAGAGSPKPLYNSAAIIADRKLIGFQDKIHLPTYDVFDELRYFTPGTHLAPWEIGQYRIGVTICEDLWESHFATGHQENWPVTQGLSAQPLDLVVNLSASPYSLHKPDLRRRVFLDAAKTIGAPIALCNQVGGNDSLIFDGHSFLASSTGGILGLAPGFTEAALLVDTNRPTVASEVDTAPAAAQLHAALTCGLHDYFSKQGFTKACLGLSGGIDSAVVACLAVAALGRDNVIGVAMPSRYSSEGSLTDAQALADRLGILLLTLPIEPPFQTYLDTLSTHFAGKSSGTAEENLQARIRGTLLMALANKFGYIVLSTGNKSELATGYSTLYGDLCGGLAPLADVTKTQVYALARWINRTAEVIPISTLTKPPSAELCPNQKDSDTLPDYAILDTILEEYIENSHSAKEIATAHGYPLSLVEDLIQRIHRHEYKRRQAPPGLRISEKAFAVGRRFPIVQRWIVNRSS